jgi:hypothetical protein
MWRQARLQIATRGRGFQGIYLWEHRRDAMRRELIVTLSGDQAADPALPPGSAP